MNEFDDFSFDDGVICKHCKRAFSFAQSHSSTLNGVTFPNRDPSVIKAQCPRCRFSETYFPRDIIKDRKIENQNELVLQLRNEIAQLKIDKEVMQKTIDGLLLQNLELVREKSQASKVTSQNESTDNPLAT